MNVGPVIPEPIENITTPSEKIEPAKFDWMKILYIVLGLIAVLVIVGIIVWTTGFAGSGSTGPTGKYYS